MQAWPAPKSMKTGAIRISPHPREGRPAAHLRQSTLKSRLFAGCGPSRDLLLRRTAERKLLKPQPRRSASIPDVGRIDAARLRGSGFSVAPLAWTWLGANNLARHRPFPVPGPKHSVRLKTQARAPDRHFGSVKRPTFCYNQGGCLSLLRHGGRHRLHTLLGIVVRKIPTGELFCDLCAGRTAGRSARFGNFCGR